ncbi:MAG: allantoinase PuuE [Gammaproteobacteria bacterium]|jgi:allantoinase|nr:allantoinase PuuE [Gammaproteobacteria bacterium]MBT3869364.1 allantoinase PuuE [Gammaproteobacteria bacterium]MBT4378336.1 allantoinase PuuE [Gammaproteobacteria bacterium]MBT4618773.1 allantoinase PuuE [Gammaproteobacteria bacterium]MBT5197005.1 allantoinase PuuE [Gammaproteobacteria bacterium]
MSNDYPRDMIGYGATPPAANWPGSARLALSFVINYEEGGENNILHGDPASETFLSEIVGANAYEARHMSMESMYEYGSRAGFWRLHRLFQRHQLPVTVYGIAMAMERNPDVVSAMLEANWEIASHGYRWIDYQFVSEETEREHMTKAIDIHERLTGSKPLGWYTGRDSPNTRKLVLEHDHFLYDSDSYADDLPYWHQHQGGNHLVIPYTLDNNDMKFVAPQGFNAGDQFYTYLKDSFDILYAEGGRMMNVGLHCRVVGKPGRAASLARFLEYVSTKPDVWVARRMDIANHWHLHHRRE